MNYAVIKSGGKQYKVSEGQILEVDKLSDTIGKISFEQVLLLVTDSGVKVGNPTLKDIKIEAEILENTQGEKIRVSKYKSKVRYRKVTGFRPLYSKIKIGRIAEDSKPIKTVKKQTKDPKKP